VVKNKQSGETLKGKLTKDVINGLRVFVLEDGTKKFLKMDDWEVVEEDPPEAAGAETTAEKAPAKEAAPDQEKPKPESGAAGTKPHKVTVYVIPIKGPIMYSPLIEAVEKALDEAMKRRAEVVVFHIDTPGGAVHIGDAVISQIEKIKFAKTVAWVEGTETNGAISCGAYISLSTDLIYMAPGTSIGAAVPFRQGSSGSAEVDEKFQSYFRARFRSLAQKRGHPAAVADAMVDSSVSVVQVFLDGQMQLVTEEEAQQMEKDHRTDGKFKRGKTVCPKGKILTLTADEALEFQLAKGKAATMEELMKAMEVPDYTVVEAGWLPDFVKKEAEKRKKNFEKWRTQFNSNWEQANLSDPHRQSYMIKDDNMTFSDSGRRWREYSEKCLGYLKNCAEALKGIEKISKEERTDYNFPDEMFNDWKARLQAMWDRVNAEKNATRMP
jgi:ATP-dependent protease ClpP protease subunit